MSISAGGFGNLQFQLRADVEVEMTERKRLAFSKSGPWRDYERAHSLSEGGALSPMK
jgi:hypothetical protein